MHVLYRESHGLDEAAVAQDLGQSPAALVVLSFSDSDLGAFAAGWHRARQAGADNLPALRLANLSDLRHPLSVDTYLETVLAQAQGILIRLIGGKSYWPYGLEQVAWIARKNGIALAVLSAEGLVDPVLAQASTIPAATLQRLQYLCDQGGEIAAQAALAQLALTAGLYAAPVRGEKSLPAYGYWHPAHGPRATVTQGTAPLILIPFYRAWLSAADTAAIAALIAAFEAQGFEAYGVFLPSLKDPATSAWLRAQLSDLSPVAIVNATAFSGRSEEGASPLDAAQVPVFQVIHSTASREAWAEAERGLSAADLAMHVALPEIDGRIPAGVISFKAKLARDPDLQISLQRHAPDPELIAQACLRICRWIGLRDQTGIAILLSTYPGKEWRLAHAVGLDALASAASVLADLGCPLAAEQIETTLSQVTLDWPLAHYLDALRGLPQALQDALLAAHGPAATSPDLVGGSFRFRGFWHQGQLIALQPERGKPSSRDTEYHDLSHVPAHGYVAFYLWLARHAAVGAILHMGAHGTLEWLPGKAAALGPNCWPQALLGARPVVYPFIVSDPGEAAQARRRLGAITLGHLPPPLAQSALPPSLAALEQLLDEYSVADGLDPQRRNRLLPLIRQEALSCGLEDSLGLNRASSAAEAFSAIDAFVCDLKESQFAAGLHIWARGTPDDRGGFTGDPLAISSEKMALATIRQGQRIAAGPSGSPWRGRHDVLPTGRNLYGIDPRAVPSKTAWAQGVKMAEELVRRHLQDHGDYPQGVMVNLWGSATMRTAGEDYAMALHLAGIAPLWDAVTARIRGFDVTPLALLDRPRISVSLRISGLFRDTFPPLITLFEQGCSALAARDEMADMNPYMAAQGRARIFMPAPAAYGAGHIAAGFAQPDRDKTAADWIAASGYGHDGQEVVQDLRHALAQIDSFVLTQDLPESDLLLSEDYAVHIGGFASASASIRGLEASLYHMDATRSGQAKLRGLSEELARITLARATQAGWLNSMQRHGARGAAEIAATAEHLMAFAQTTRDVSPQLFAQYHAATLADPQIRAFMSEANAGALAALDAVFEAVAQAGIWCRGRNSGADL